MTITTEIKLDPGFSRCFSVPTFRLVKRPVKAIRAVCVADLGQPVPQLSELLVCR